MKKKFLFFSSIFIVSCSSASPVAPRIDSIQNPFTNNTSVVNNYPSSNNLSSETSDYDFFNKLKSLSINLSDSETQLIKKYQDFSSIGEWASSETMSDKNVLEKNFQDYKNTFKIKLNDSSEYMDGAINFSKSNNFYAKFYFDLDYYRNKNKIAISRWDPQTKEFLIIHSDGKISNYQIVENLSTSRYIILPESTGKRNVF
ncbi:MAG: hypothetical protein AABZ74_14100 [Cyanobacteriota bacterium]